VYRKDDLLLEEAYELVQLNELFDNPYPYTVDERDSPSFHEENTRYAFSISEPDSTGKVPSFPKYTVSFELNKEDVTLSIEFSYHKSPGSGSRTDLTGTGNASRVLATVMSIAKKYIEQEIKDAEEVHPEAFKQLKIQFSGKSSDKGRIKFYNTLASLLVKFLEQKSGIKWEWESDPLGSTEFYLISANKEESDKDQAAPKSSLNKFL
jgi:hypothetical protein